MRGDARERIEEIQEWWAEVIEKGVDAKWVEHDIVEKALEDVPALLAALQEPPGERRVDIVALVDGDVARHLDVAEEAVSELRSVLGAAAKLEQKYRDEGRAPQPSAVAYIDVDDGVMAGVQKIGPTPPDGKYALIPLHDPDPEQEKLGSLVDELVQWACETFPEASAASCVAHLRSEVEELSGTPEDPEELADAAMLIFHAAYHAGVDLKKAIRAKLEKNRGREWGPANDQGFREHVRDPDPEPEGEHRWVGSGEYGSRAYGEMCGDCGVDIGDDEALEPCPATSESGEEPLTGGDASHPLVHEIRMMMYEMSGGWLWPDDDDVAKIIRRLRRAPDEGVGERFARNVKAVAEDIVKAADREIRRIHRGGADGRH